MKQPPSVAVFRTGLMTMLVLRLLSGLALAQPRATPEADQPERADPGPPPTTGAWLQRIPGRYIFDGSIHHVDIAEYDRTLDFPNGWVHGTKQYLNEWIQPATGKGDCIAVADAPGVQCVINLVWPETWMPTGRVSLGGVSDLTLAMLVAGVNPADQSIRFLMVDFRGLGHPGSLVLKGNTASTLVDCVNLPGLIGCKQKFTIEAREDSQRIFVTLQTETRYLRNKMDRKPLLSRIDLDYDPNEGPQQDNYLGGERPREWVDEFLTVSFSMRREAAAIPEARPPGAAPMSAPEPR